MLDITVHSPDGRPRTLLNSLKGELLGYDNFIRTRLRFTV